MVEHGAKTNVFAPCLNIMYQKRVVYAPLCKVIKRMFEPGWEQLIGLFRFYVHFHQKLESEVNDTIEALQSLRELQSLLNEMDRLAGKDYDTIWSRPSHALGWLSWVRRA